MSIYNLADADIASQLCLVVKAGERTNGFLIPYYNEQPLHAQLMDRIYGRTDFNTFEFILYEKESGERKEVVPGMTAREFGYEATDIFLVIANPLASFEVQGHRTYTLRLFRTFAATLLNMTNHDLSRFSLVTLYDVAIPRFEYLGNSFSGGNHVLKIKEDEKENQERKPESNLVELILFVCSDYKSSSAYRYMVEPETNVHDFVKSKMEEEYNYIFTHYAETQGIEKETIIDDLNPTIVVAIPVIDVTVKFGDRKLVLKDRYMFCNTALNILMTVCNTFNINYEEYRLLNRDDDGLLVNWNLYDLASANIKELAFSLEQL